MLAILKHNFGYMLYVVNYDIVLYLKSEVNFQNTLKSVKIKLKIHIHIFMVVDTWVLYLSFFYFCARLVFSTSEKVICFDTTQLSNTLWSTVFWKSVVLNLIILYQNIKNIRESYKTSSLYINFHCWGKNIFFWDMAVGVLLLISGALIADLSGFYLLLIG